MSMPTICECSEGGYGTSAYADPTGDMVGC